MVERPFPPQPEEHLVRLKSDILHNWEQLPPDHQARVALVLLRRLFDREQQDLSVNALKTLGSVVTPSHLRQASLTEEEIAQLTDDDIEQVVHQVVNHFIQDLVWDELEFAARKILYEKDQDRAPSSNHG